MTQLKSATALRGRSEKMQISATHFVNGHSLQPPFPETMQQALLGMGCFWGAEKAFWSLEGIYTTAVGYAAGVTPNPTYQEVCSGQTGHNEVVFIVYDPAIIAYKELLKVFWETHNPTQGMRQGNDTGTQYRSGIYYFSAQQQQSAMESLQQYQQALSQAKQPTITTEILEAGQFYYAEEYHQQYLAKNVHGYCGLGGLGVKY